MSLPSINGAYILYIVLSILCFVPAIVFHEVAHGYAAYKLGDPTAKRAGRLSLNPLKHIDIFGTIIMPACLMILQMPVFGYAKPVPYNPSYFEDPRKGDLFVGLAGPLANLALAGFAALIAWICYLLVPQAAYSNIVYLIFYQQFLPMFVLFNLYLMMFNLLPIPPLDGSSIIAVFIPVKYLGQYYKIQRYALPIFMALVILVPYIFHINPIGAYLNATAGNLANLMLPGQIS